MEGKMNSLCKHTELTHPHMSRHASLEWSQCLFPGMCACVLCSVIYIHKIIKWEINTQTRIRLKTNRRSFLATKYRLFTVVVCLLLAGGGGNGEAKVIRPKRSSCLEGAGQQQQLVYSTLPPPPPLIKNEWWAVVGHGREWGLCPGDTERASVTERLDTPWTDVDSPEVVIKRALKLLSIRWKK